MTGGLWLFTARLWRATVNLGRDAKEIARAQSEKMECSIAEAARAAEAMNHANQIILQAQRAWVRLGAKPQLVRRDGVDGLYVRMDFTGENIGKSPATHFDIQHATLFQGQEEQSPDLLKRIAAQIEKWKESHVAAPKSVLAPNDLQIAGIWDSYKSQEVAWWDMNIGFKTAHPILLAAVIYRTISAPNLVQLSYRYWYLVALGE